MFKGKASLVPGQKGGKKQGMELVAGQAKSVTQTGQVREIRLEKEAFVRKFDSETGLLWRGKDLDLADIVGGGNGFGTGKLGVSINPDTGKVQDGFVNMPRFSETGNYVPMMTREGIDGVFVPDGGEGDVIVTSVGHVFQECPDTTGGYFCDIYNGNEVIFNNNSFHILDGIEYGTANNPGITIHSNAGITFDLDNIRSRAFGREIAAFKSKCGMVDHKLNQMNKLRFWVLVDGQVRYRSNEVGMQDSAEEINVKLTNRERFLTLIVDDAWSSDGHSRPEFDWAIFAEPRLELK
jgi:hypothetical protein